MLVELLRKAVLEPEQVDLFGEIECWVPVLLENEGATCHSICAHLAEAYPDDLIHRKGRFGGTCDHSWLVFKGAPNLILDACPVACLGGPILVDTGTNLVLPTAWAGLYQESASRIREV